MLKIFLKFGKLSRSFLIFVCPLGEKFPAWAWHSWSRPTRPRTVGEYEYRLLFYNIIKAINAAVNLKFYYCRARSKQYASMFTWQFFTVKLMFLSWSWEKVYSKMIVKSIFKCRKTINSPENCYWEKITFQKMICTRHSLYSSRRWQQQQYSPLFLTIG